MKISIKFLKCLLCNQLSLKCKLNMCLNKRIKELEKYLKDHVIHSLVSNIHQII